jgi:tRNA-specific 2-thiouridylase
VLGRHDGVHRFTVGQRKGLGLATGEPMFVVALDAERKVVTVGPRRSLDRTAVEVGRVNWISGNPPSGPLFAEVQIRHRHAAAPARIEPTGAGTASVVFETPQQAVTPGQAAVFYAGDEILGGGWID